MSRLNEPGRPELRNSLLFFRSAGDSGKARVCWRTSSPSGPSSEDHLHTFMLPSSRISEVGRRPLPHDLAVESLMASTLSIGNGSTSVTDAHRKRHGLSWQSQVGVQLAVIPLSVAHRNRPACMKPSAPGCVSSTWTKVHFKFPIRTPRKC